jgi:hypothetical protein
MFGMKLASQGPMKPLDPAKAKTRYSFAVRSGEDPLRFEVQVNSSSTITGVEVFRSGQSDPFQVLPACKRNDDLTMQLTEYDDERELLKHQDLNFDGYEDVELLQYYVPHLGKSLFCIYVWNAKGDRFTEAPEIPDTDPVAHADTRTISVHEDFFGGVFTDSIYKWSGSKLGLILESGRLYGSDKPTCGFTDFCRQLINGKLVDTALRPSGCGDIPDRQLICPAVTSKNQQLKRSQRQQ